MSNAMMIGTVGLVAALILPMFAIRLLRWMGVIDAPNHRSSHTIPTVRGVGVACTAAMLIGAAVGVSGKLVDRSILTIVVLSALIAVLGLIEDLRGLRISMRLAGQLVIGSVAGAALVLSSDETPWAIVLVAVWVAGYVNVANFMDGVDSISGLHGVVAGSYYALLGMFADQSVLMVVGVLTASVFLGFLPWNTVGRRRAFLGDVGSYLLGALVSLLAAAAWLSGYNPVVSVAPTVAYIADTTWTIVKRALRHEPLTQPHRAHVYQRLTGVGWTHVASGLTVALLSAVSGAVALFAWSGSISESAAVLMIGVATIVYLSLPWVAAGWLSRQTPGKMR